MEGNPKVIEVLNEIVRAEITGINQYFVHAKMCENWGYHGLYEFNEKNSIDEMKHAEKLLERILYLKGIPKMEKDRLNIGKDVTEQLKNDHELEKSAILRLQQAIKLCIEEADSGSRELLEHILMDEEGHASNLEAYLHQVDEMGIESFLSTQVQKK